MTADVESYLSKLANEGKAPATVRVYRMALGRFVTWLDAREPTGAAVNAYVRYLQQELALRPRTIRPAMAAVRGYLAWLQETGRIVAAPIKIKLPALDAPESYCPTDEEVERIWRTVEALPQKTEHQRFKRRRILTVLALLAWAGLRHAELQALEVDDVNLGERTLRIRCGKGGKTDWLPLSSPDLRDYLSSWLTVRAEWAEKHRPQPHVAKALFPVDSRRIWGDAANRAMWDWLNAQARPSKRVTDHCLRRYYGTTLSRRGSSLADTSRLMRHRSLGSTLDYLKWDNHSIAEQAAKLGRGAINPCEPKQDSPRESNSPVRAERRPDGKDRREWLRNRREGRGK